MNSGVIIGGSSGVRNAALIATMFGAGLRVSEALALRPSDLDLDRGTVRVQHGEGDRSRTVALDPSAQVLPAITAQLGHSSTAVTDRYLRQIAPADLVEQIRDRGRLT